jgi:hypothetical protein
MFFDNSGGVLHRHIPAAEINHFAAQMAMLGV